MFAELIGLKRDRGLETCESAWKWLGSVRPDMQVAACARPGLSPHAPYSTSGWLYYKAVASRTPLSTHLAEMPEELRCSNTATGRSGASSKISVPGTMNGNRSALDRPTTCAGASYDMPTG